MQMHTLNFYSFLLYLMVNQQRKKYTILSNGIYEFFASNYGVTHNIQKRKTNHTLSTPKTSQKNFAHLKNQVHKDFRNAKKKQLPFGSRSESYQDSIIN